MAKTAIQVSLKGRSIGLASDGSLVINMLDGRQLCFTATGPTITSAAGVTTGVGAGSWGAISGTLTDQLDIVAALALKQAVLVSATNIKTVGGVSLLGSGDTALAWGQLTGTLSNQTDLNTALGLRTLISTIVNDLTTGGTAVPLSAEQGKALKVTADALATTVSGKQATLVSGTSIKTINSTTLLGSGDIVVSASAGVTVALSGTTLTLSSSNTSTYNGNTIAANNASAQTITINSGAALTAGIVIEQLGAGIVSVVAGASVTLNARNALSTAGAGTTLVLIPETTDVYSVFSPPTGIGINNQTGTTYTLVASDAGGRVDMSNASANTLTIPSNASVPFPIGTTINVRQGGAGATTIAISSDTLVKPASRSLTISAQYEQAQLTKTLVTTWECIAS